MLPKSRLRKLFRAQLKIVTEATISSDKMYNVNSNREEY